MLLRLRMVLAATGFGLWAASAPAAQSQPTKPGRGQWVPSWQIEYGGYRQLTALSVVSEDEAWGLATADVGAGAVPWPQTAFVHWIDGTALAQQVVNHLELRALEMAGPDMGLAVGRRGQVYRFDGREWRRIDCPVASDLTDVALLRPDDGWVVGDLGTILRWDGKDLSVAESPVELIRIAAIDMVAPSQGWAVTRDGRVLVYDGTWTIDDAPAVDELTDVAFRDSDVGLAVGRGVLERVDGSWRQVETDARWTVSVAWDDDVAYVVADDRVIMRANDEWSEIGFEAAPVPVETLGYRWVHRAVGGVWALVPDGSTIWVSDGIGRYVWPTVRTLRALEISPQVSDSSDAPVMPEVTGSAWAGGESLVHAVVGPTDGAWRSTFELPVSSEVTDISIVSEDDAWAVGTVGDGTMQSGIWRWDGSDWSDWPIDKLWLVSGIEMLSSDDGFVSGTNVVARWDGEVWSPLTDVPDEAKTGVFTMLAGGDSPEGWFGAVGEVYHLVDGEWMPESLPTDEPVKRIDFASAREGWATTDTEAFGYDGTSWRQLDMPRGTSSVIRDVHTPLPGEVWFAVDPDGLFHWDQGEWELHPLSALGPLRQPYRLRAVPFSTQDGRGTHVWLAGDAPTLARYRIVAPTVQLYVPVAKVE